MNVPVSVLKNVSVSQEWEVLEGGEGEKKIGHPIPKSAVMSETG